MHAVRLRFRWTINKEKGGKNTLTVYKEEQKRLYVFPLRVTKEGVCRRVAPRREVVQ